MPVQAIIFDLDETLIEDRQATQCALRKACLYAQARVQLDSARLRIDAYRHAKLLWAEAPTYAYCYAIGISASEGMWGRFEGEAPDLQALFQWAPVFQQLLWKRALAEQDIINDALAEALAACFREERRSCYRVFSDVEAALSTLKQRYALALLTNGAPDLQREKIRASGLESYFDTIAVSGEVGIGKPEPEIFVHVLRELGVAPEQAVMVGDSLPRDIAGSYHSGMRGMWINRYDDACQEEYRPMIASQISVLDELEAVL
ncbi:HAD family hydrolase [Ktedonobacter racemifer]|uniref:Phosphoserine phosphatase n=1 Tax=Ktedonobacter racemifer DSM 44963 TaxID=485913 RepID=D6TEM0_KTERA|nr:HAD family hydrolase [Ktedonobacter racemifer]EFH88469.1 HAD-superfamily hydrolase, subfamily IA, variant 1 [Ktedonobacter racemifer DSM 44963]